MSEHERPVFPFSDLHVENDHVRVVLLHDPTVEGLDVALYLDGSASMKQDYEATSPPRTFWQALMGHEPAPAVSAVEPQARWMLEYLASKDRNGSLRVAYWATGEGGRVLEVLGELGAANARTWPFQGPNNFGDQTRLVPAIKDFLRYLETQVPEGAKRGCAVFITDGKIHDAEEVKTLSIETAKRVARGQLPRVNFVLVGVGEGVDEEQLESISHIEHPGVGHLWCHRVADEIREVAELVAVLVDETMTVAAGGTVYDDRGKVLRAYEGRLPAVLEFPVPEGAKSFTLEIAGKRYVQPLPEEGDH